MVVLSKGNTGMADGSDETSAGVVKETVKTQASFTRAQLTHQWWVSESKMPRASVAKEGGVDLARCTTLQKLPHKQSNR